MKRRLAQSLGLGCLLWGSGASAEIPGLSLSWRAPEGCPSQQQVERAVLTGRIDREAAPGRQVSAEVVVERKSDGSFRAKLTTLAPEGRGARELEGESCDAIASASAVVLALALDPPPAPAAPPEPVQPPRAREPATPEVRPHSWIGYAHVFGGGVLRALPRPSPSFGLGLGARRGPIAAELLASLSPTQTVDASAPPGASAAISLFSAQAIGCFAPVLSATTALEVCAGALFERLAGASSGISNPATNSVVLLSPELALRSRIQVSSRVQLALGVTGAARPVQPRFVIGGVGQVHEIPVFDGMLDAGLLFSF